MVNFLRKEGSRSDRAASYSVEIANSHGIRQEDIANLFGISQPALSQAIQRHTPGKAPRRGRPPYLENDQSNELFNWVTQRIHQSNSPTIQQIREKASELKGTFTGSVQKLPCRKWVKKWMKMNELITRLGKTVPRATVYINPMHIKSFLDKYDTWLTENGDNGHYIWNFDETGVHIQYT